MRTFSVKKILGLLCALCLCMALSAPVFAADNNLTIEQLEQKFAQGVGAYMLSDDGEKIDLEIESVDVVRLPLPSIYKFPGNEDYALYAATTKIKTEDTTYRQYGISAAASLTMTWIDGKGANNTITNLSGYATIAAGTFKSAVLNWGSYSTVGDAQYRLSVGTTFDEDINYTSDMEIWGTVRADYRVDIEPPDGGSARKMHVWVHPLF